MNDVEKQTRTAMTLLADHVVPVDLLARLDRAAALRPRRPRARRWALAATAAVVVVAVLLGARGLLHGPRPDVIHPVVHPPKVVRLADGASASPGRALMEVTLAPTGDHEAETFVLVAGRDEAIRVPMSAAVPLSYSRHLSHDGTRLMLQHDSASTPRMEVLDLRTGSRHDVGGKVGYCPRLSPDNRTVAAWEPSVEEPAPLVLLDVVTGERRALGQAEHPFTSNNSVCTDVAWSPDGALLAAPDVNDTVVTDPDGQAVARFPNQYAVNGGQSWSPDSTRILLYDRAEGRYVVRTISTGEETSLGENHIMTVPVGWAGSRVVWLAGSPGDQRLVTTDDEGRDERLWTRFDVGDRAVHTVSWSSALAGTEA
jgi:hypothetical protein